MANDELAGGIQISQSDLLQAASSMGPSVSDSERHRYQEMYVILFKHLRPSIYLLNLAFVGYEEFCRSRRVLSTRILHIVQKLNLIIALLFVPNIFPFLKEFAILLFVFMFTKNNTLSQGFLGQWINNLQQV